ncbi:MAG: teicoplanin resistance protein VanZ [Gemmatimonadetes bacterium]|nr:teicoplanin resistance protein VanZ [Gemmatimonadota bacterium]
MSLSRLNLTLWVPVAAWAAAILVLNSIPNPPSAPPTVVPVDKIVHFMEYCGLGALLFRAARGSAWKHPLAWAIALGVAYGVADEVHQAYLPTRYAELADVLADAVGASAGALILRLTRRRREPETDLP